MDNNSFNDTGGMPAMNNGSPDPGDADIKISNTGQRIRAILVAVVAVVAGIAFLVWYSGKQGEIERHETAKSVFETAHRKGYVSFWVKAQVDTKEMKSNADFEARLKQIISDDPVRYGRFVKEECLPILDSALPDYKSIEAPTAYADQVNALSKAVEAMRNAWNAFADDLLKFEAFVKSTPDLDRTADAWFGAQQSDNEKFTVDAYRYFKLLGCVLPGEAIEKISVQDINLTVKDSCQAEKAAWFRRVAHDCLPALKKDPGAPSEAYAAAIAASRDAPRMDHASKFGIQDCLKETRGVLESEIIEPLARTWVDYVKTQKALLDAIDAALAELR
ncbi:MAG: hypothetical protein QNJ97_11730 [Myxococcota bacterium]|nr:hypothetical protein [Myxococcota bacterium]